MSLTVYVYCNGVEQGYIEVVHGETNESLHNKISATFCINDFVFDEDFDVVTLCQDDNIYIKHDKVKEAERTIESYVKNTGIIISLDNDDFIQALIAYNNISAVKDLGNNVLYYIVKCNRNDVLHTLIANSIDLNVKDDNSDTPLHLASKSGYTDMVQTIINSGVDINIKDMRGDTPLHVASWKGNNDVVQILIKAGADINSINNNAATPIHWASYCGHDDVVMTLIKGGANINVTDNINRTPLNMAHSEQHNNVAYILIAAGSDINIMDIYGNSYLSYVSKYNM